jgi:exopolysaccharide biosynthesis protein
VARISLISFALGIILAGDASAAPCTKPPAPGGEPALAGATALRAELCRLRASPSTDRASVLINVKHSNMYDVEFAMWEFSLAHARIEVVSAASDAGETAPAFKARTGAVFAINGGFFDFGPQHELRPVGLLIENGVIKKPLSRALSGTLLINGPQVEIQETSSVVTAMGYTYGLQSKPLLVDPGNRLGMRGDDHVRVPRSAICLPDAKHVVFIYAGESGLSLFELANLLQAPANTGGFGCDVALNLDGGPSTQVAGTIDGETFERLGQNVANAIVVREH